MAEETELQIRSDVKAVFAGLYLVAAAAVEESKMRPSRTPGDLALERQVEATREWLARAERSGS